MIYTRNKIENALNEQLKYINIELYQCWKENVRPDIEYVEGQVDALEELAHKLNCGLDIELLITYKKLIKKSEFIIED